MQHCCGHTALVQPTWKNTRAPAGSTDPDNVPTRQYLPQAAKPVLHLMQLSPQLEPDHRPPTVLAPPPLRGQTCHQPEPPAGFGIIADRAKLRRPRAAAIGDLDPDSTSAGRDRDHLPGTARAAVLHAVAEQLAHQQNSVIPARMPRPQHRAHERADDPCPLRPPGNAHALPDRRPHHQHPPSQPPGKAPQGSGRTHGEYTLTSAAGVKPDQRPGRASCAKKRSAASAESFFGALKNEMYYRQSFPGRAQARFAIADYIEVFYNCKRLHSTLGYRTPAEALTEFQTAAAAA